MCELICWSDLRAQDEGVPEIKDLAASELTLHILASAQVSVCCVHWHSFHVSSEISHLRAHIYRITFPPADQFQERRKPSQHGSAVPEHSQIDYVVCVGKALDWRCVRRLGEEGSLLCLWCVKGCDYCYALSPIFKTSPGAPLPGFQTPRLSLFSWNAFLARRLYLTFHGGFVKLYTVYFIQTGAVNKRSVAPAGCIL